VAIARALASKPKIIAADEPTGSLDPRTAKKIMDLLLALCKEEQVTLLLVTHAPELADLCSERFDCSGLITEAGQ
jgi:ABC-type lipoprotein export system ATPase subunit